MRTVGITFAGVKNQLPQPPSLFPHRNNNTQIYQRCAEVPEVSFKLPRANFRQIPHSIENIACCDAANLRRNLPPIPPLTPAGAGAFGNALSRGVFRPIGMSAAA